MSKLAAPIRYAVMLAFFLGTPACGAKTGLLIPDDEPGREDAGPDAGQGDEYCVDVDPETRRGTLELQFTTELPAADVLFLIDCTGSMRGEISNIQRELTNTIVPGALAQIPDTHFGVAALSDFPVDDFGAEGDVPFELRRALTDDVGAVQAAIDGLPRWDGGDIPESQTEALYQIATGAGLGSFIPPAPGCPRGGLGYPCFREGTQPVVVLVTDAPFHDGPYGADRYINISPEPHDFDQALDALNELGARVVGIDSGEAYSHLAEAARRTGAVDSSGVPLVYTISPTGDGLDLEVVRGIQTLARSVPLDVDGIALDVAGDDLDATMLVEQIVAIRAEPASAVSAIEDNTFSQVLPGTELFFRIDVRVDVIPVPAVTQLYPVLVRIRGNRVTVLHEVVVNIEVPGTDGSPGC